ncbi:unnamed protein product [Vicia faba]|uniref:Uncharacterized protein n=1 Tax=Vicia faba TaxID=3906 RepID=A0AAV1ALB6_VICFA|nr:unnamed protein product [Vicia faba]
MAAGRQSVLGRRESYKHDSVKEFEDYKFDSSAKDDREEGEILVDGDEALPPPEKRRKFSPIVWDPAEKQAKISSKDGVTRVAESLARSPVDEHSPEGKGVLSESSCVVDESDMQGWNITKSKWASHDLSPMGDDDKYKQGKRSSSLEVGGSSSSTITRSDFDDELRIRGLEKL